MRLFSLLILIVCMCGNVICYERFCNPLRFTQAVDITNGSHVFDLDGDDMDRVMQECSCRSEKTDFFMMPLTVGSDVISVLVACSDDLPMRSLHQLLMMEYLKRVPSTIRGIEKSFDHNRMTDPFSVALVAYPSFTTFCRLVRYYPNGQEHNRYYLEFDTGYFFPKQIPDLQNYVPYTLADLIAPNNTFMYDSCMPHFGGRLQTTISRCVYLTQITEMGLNYIELCCCPHGKDICDWKPPPKHQFCAYTASDNKSVVAARSLISSSVHMLAYGQKCALYVNFQLDREAETVHLQFDLKGSRSSECPTEVCRSDRTSYCSDFNDTDVVEDRLTCCCPSRMCNLDLLVKRLFFHFNQSTLSAPLHCRYNTLMLPFMYKPRLCNAFYDPLLDKAVRVDVFHQLATYVDTYYTRDHVKENAVEPSCDMIVAKIHAPDSENCSVQNYDDEDVSKARLFYRCSCVNKENESFCDLELVANMPSLWKWKRLELVDHDKYPECHRFQLNGSIYESYDDIYERLEKIGTDPDDTDTWRNFMCYYSAEMTDGIYYFTAYPIDELDVYELPECLLRPYYERKNEMFMCCHHRFYLDRNGKPLAKRCTPLDLLKYISDWLTQPNITTDEHTQAALTCGHEKCPMAPNLGCYFVRPLRDQQGDGFRGGCLALLLHQKEQTELLTAVAPCAQEAFEGRCFAAPTPNSKPHDIACCCHSKDRCEEITRHYAAIQYGSAVRPFITEL